MARVLCKTDLFICNEDCFPCGTEIDEIDLITCKFQDSFEPNLKYLVYKLAMTVYSVLTLAYLYVYTIEKQHPWFKFDCPQEFFIALFILIGYTCFTFQFLWVTANLFVYYIKDWTPNKKQTDTLAELPKLIHTHGLFLTTQIIGQNLAFPVFFGYFIWNSKFDFVGIVYGFLYFIIVFVDEIFNLHSAPRKWFYVPFLPYFVVLGATLVTFQMHPKEYKKCRKEHRLDTNFLGGIMPDDNGMMVFYFLKFFEVIISFFCMIYTAAVLKNCIKPDEDEEDED